MARHWKAPASDRFPAGQMPHGIQKEDGYAQ